MKLVIFDLDQTLVDFIPVHDKATAEVFKRFFGVDAKLTELDFAGKNLMENFVALAKLKNVPEEKFKGRSEDMLSLYERVFKEHIPDDVSGFILPGAVKLLEELSKTDSVVALYTGSPRGVVHEVFRVTELGKYFKFAFFGTEVQARADMVRLAIEKAEALTGKRFEGKDIVIIGDSVRDVECGKLFKALSVAVATGFHSEEKLRKSGADYVFKDLEEIIKAY